MLEPKRLQEISAICEYASSCLNDWGYKNLSLKSVIWQDDKQRWVVEFVTDERITQNISVAIEPYYEFYRYRGVVR